MLELNRRYYYVGVNIPEIDNRSVTVIEQSDVCGTNQDHLVYTVSDDEGNLYKVAECNLSTRPYISRNIIVESLKDCFPEDVLRCPSFTPRGRYIGDIQ